MRAPNHFAFLLPALLLTLAFPTITIAQNNNDNGERPSLLGRFLTGRAIKAGTKIAVRLYRTSRIVRLASEGKGNFGVGQGSRADADAAGKDWVGPDYRLSSDRKAWISKDGLRQYRPPSLKKGPGVTQANFQSRMKPSGNWLNNGHLDIVP